MIRDQSVLQSLVEQVSRFVRERLVPCEAEVAETDCVPPDIIADMRELGLFGMSIPEEFGGLGLTMEEEVMVAFVLGRTSPAFRSVFGTNNGIGSQGLIMGGTPEQKRKYLPRMATGEIIGSFALTEPDAGSDAGSLRTSARRGDGGWILNGTKRFITNAPQAGLLTVFARTNPDSKDASGVSAFVVERNAPGLRFGNPDRKMGQKGAQTCDVIMEDCHVPMDALLGGREGQGFKTAMMVLDRGRLHISAVCVGAAERLIGDALRYAIERKQFGQPIAEFQLIQAMLADSQTEALAGRSMVMETARKKDEGTNVATDAACCKLFCSEMVGRVADRALQIHGGAGLSQDFFLAEAFAETRFLRIGDGPDEVHREAIARVELARH